MKILFLAPQPFFQERGTPIAVRLALEVLAARGRDEVHLLTYHEGTDLPIPHVHHHRIVVPKLLRPLLSGVGPGISWRKLVCDLIFTIHALSLVLRNRAQPFHLIHAVEESVFIARAIKAVSGIPYIYDMDSSLAMQLTEKWWILRPLKSVLEWWERLAVRDSLAVVPVCDALAIIAERHGSPDTHLLRDISLLDLPRRGELGSEIEPHVDIREEIGATPEEVLILYIGNLEPYQGVDLLVSSFAQLARDTMPPARVVVIGGSPGHIAALRGFAAEHGIGERLHLLGPRPLALLSAYLAQADVVVSPRVRGNNTPMKIYSYLHSGRAVLATDLPTHRQVLNEEFALLAPPRPESFARALHTLICDRSLREQLGRAAALHASTRYTYEVFERSLAELYERIEARIAKKGGGSRPLRTTDPNDRGHKEHILATPPTTEEGKNDAQPIRRAEQN